MHVDDFGETGIPPPRSENNHGSVVSYSADVINHVHEYVPFGRAFGFPPRLVNGLVAQGLSSLALASVAHVGNSCNT